VPAFVFASIEHAVRHLDVAVDARWTIKFANNETRAGRITEIRGGSYLLEEDSGDMLYFDARKVLYMQPALPARPHVQEAPAHDGDGPDAPAAPPS
jgi:hypothetical protein